MITYQPVCWSYENICRILDINNNRKPGLSGKLFKDIQAIANLCSQDSLYLPFAEKMNEVKKTKRAFAKGAAAAVISIEEDNFLPDDPVIQVPCRLDALKKLAFESRSCFSGSLVAITGSTGKTTTKDLTQHSLSHFGPCHSSYQNRNLEHSVTLAVAQIPASAKFSVIEISSIGPKTIGKVCFDVLPNIAIVTNVGYSHAKFFSSLQDTLAEKLSLLDSLTGERIAILGRSVYDMDKAGMGLLKSKKINRLITVGHTPNDTVQLIDLHQESTRVSATAKIADKYFRYSLFIPAPHIAYNALFVLAVAHEIGLDLDRVVQTFSSFKGTHRRLERSRINVRGSGKIIELIDDAYNASPDSVKALLEIVKQRENVLRRVMIFGDMLELGSKEEQLHEDLAENILDSGVDLLITVGNLSGRLAKILHGHIECLSFLDYSVAQQVVPDLLEHGDFVVVKASRATFLNKVVHAITGEAIYKTAASPDWTVEAEINKKNRGNES